MLKIKLSPYAKLFYTEWLLDSSSGRYNITIDQTLCGVLDVARLGKSLHRYVAEHLLLNSHIQEIDGEPYWVENDEIKELEYLDNHVSTSELLFYVSRSFDLHREPLYRFRLLFIKKGVYRLILVFHHLVVDGSSSLDPGVFAAISNYYNDDHYTAKYSIKEQAKLISDLTDILNTNLLQNRTKYTEFWHQQLQDVESIDLNFLKLGRNDGSPNVVESENPIGIIKIDYGDLELANLNQIKERYGVTPYSYGGSIFALLLHRYTGQERLAISYPIAIREGIDFIYGAQINTNLMPYQFTPTTTITDLLNQNKEFFKLTIKNDLKYGYYPIADIIQEHQNKQLLDICFAQTCFREHPLKFNGITKVEPSSELSIDGVAKNILLFEHNARGNKLEYRIRYDQRVINEELLNNFVASYKKLFSEILAELAIGKSDERISSYELLTREQYQKLVYEFNQTGAEYPHDQTVHALFEEQVRKTPNNIAVTYENCKLTYLELNKKSNQLAHYLRHHYQIKPDNLVVLCLNRSEQMITAMLAVLKAGGAYVPIDPNYPDERIGYILKDTKTKVILTNELHNNRLQKLVKQKSETQVVLAIDSKKIQTNLGSEKSSNLTIKNNSHNLIYVIYTSGTTGNPKGVMIEHRGVVSLVKNVDYIRVNPHDSFIQFSDPGFDAATFEIWTPLLNGAKLVIPENKIDLFGDIKSLRKTLTKNKVTVLWLTKSLFGYLFTADESIFESIKYLLVGGEALNKPLISRLVNSNDAPKNVINGYGPTENTTFSCTLNITKESLTNVGTVPIGTPLTNRKAYVLDKNLIPLPMGAIGELCVGGAGLARGYLNNSDLTAEKFIDNPLQTEEEKRIHENTKLYKTGDLVRMLSNGNLEFIGRRDFQVKIRGFRIELGEIESKLIDYCGIKQSIAIVMDNISSSYNSTSDNKIVLYYVANSKINKKIIIEYLLKQLPSYMLPNAVIYLKQLPLTANGKINRDALPKPESFDKSNYVAPKTDLEIRICKVYSEILSLPINEIGIEDNFFDLGGNSLAAIRLTGTINQQLKSNIQVREVLQNGTIKNIAVLISDKTRQFVYQNYVIQNTVADDLYKPFELTNIQQAYYFGRFESFTLSNTSAHLYTEYEFKSLNISKLGSALNKLIARHHNLRMVFEDGKQRYIEFYPYYQVKFYKLNDISELENIRKEYSHKVYVINQLWLFDIFVSRIKNKYILHLSVDALIMDASSIWIFLDELSRLYQDPLCELPKLNISYRDYIEQSLIIRESNLFTKAKKYWLSRIDDYDFELTLPLQKQPNTISRPKFSRISKELDAETWKKITAKVNHYGIGQTAVLLHIYGYVLSYWSNQNKLCINLTLFNRLPLHKQINNLIGDFTVLELFNFVSEQSHNMSNLSLLFKSTSNRLWEDIEHNLFDGLDFQRLARNKSSVSSNDKIIAPVVLTSVLGTDYGNIKILDESCVGINYSITQTPQVWLDNKAYEQDGKLIVEWDYVEELFAAETIKAMHEHYFTLIKYLANADWDEDRLPLLELPKLDREIIERANLATQTNTEDNLFCRYEFLVTKKNLTKKIAVVDVGNNNKNYTYQTLLKDSDLLARHILLVISNSDNLNNKNSANIALSDTKLIAVLSGKGYNQVISTLSIMKAGFGYLPLSIEWPLLRVEEILDQAGAQILLISREAYAKYKLIHKLAIKCRLIVIEEILESIANESLQSSSLLNITLPIVNTDNVAYVIFTSGSTGKPKGVIISHRGALNTIDAVNNKFAVTKNDIVLAMSELSFDLSVYDIFGLLAVGGTIVFLPQHRMKEPKCWLEIIDRYKISIWNSVPQLAELLIDALDISNNLSISSIRLFLLSGDWIPTSLHARIKKYCYEAKIMSLGGATEGSIWSIWYEINKVPSIWNSIPYGDAMPNQKMYVLNNDSQHCPVNVIGEIYIGGIGVALGYWKNPSRTAESFIDHPQFGRVYKTGDLGRWHSNGYMEFIGRRDNQTKIRGYRIELEEIEKKLTTCPGITQAVVVVKKHASENYLVAYYVSPSKLDDETIQSSLRSKLPDYMIPGILIHLTKLPLTANGKFDLAALDILTDLKCASISDYMPPSNELEYKICSVYAEVLDLPINQISINDDFFKLGGNSISAIRLISRLQQYVNISLSDLFQLKTPFKIAQQMPAVINGFDQHRALERLKLLYKKQKIVEPNVPAINLKRDGYLKEIKQLTFKKRFKSIHNILLTGSTGFLGCNILYQLLSTTDYKIYLLVREVSNSCAYDRISNKFNFYFDTRLDNYTNRLVVLGSNLEQPNLGLEAIQYQNLVTNIDGIIHAAALVKHYGDYDAFYRANVQSTINLCELAKLTSGKDFHYISTTGIFMDGYIPNCSYYIFNENDNPEALINGSNFYLKTKYEGEVIVRNYRQHGITSNIYRVGNLTAHSINYRSQENIEDNAFIHCLKTMLDLGITTKELSMVEISPVDYTALGIVKIFNQTYLSDQTHHIFNPTLYDFTKLLSTHDKFNIRKISIESFINQIAEKLKNRTKHNIQLELFVLHQRWFQHLKYSNLTKIEVLQDKTNTMLSNLGFKWPKITKEMLLGSIALLYPYFYKKGGSHGKKSKSF